MNKKFSTLVASLLLSSAFSVYAGNAKPMLATPTQVETRATSADVEKAVEVGTAILPDYSGAVNLDGHVLAGFTNNARIAYVSKLGGTESTAQYLCVNGTTGAVQRVQDGYGTNVSEAPNYYWTLQEGRLVTNSGIEFSLSGLDEYVEIVPIQKEGELTEIFAIAKRDNDGNLQYAEVNGGTIGWSTLKAQDYEANIASAALFVSVETAYNTELTGDKVNAVLNDGFNLLISSLRDEDVTIANADVFSGKLVAMHDGTTKATASDADYYLMNEDGKFIVFDRTEDITSDANAIKGKFKLVNFANAGNETTQMSDPIYNQFVIKSADNGSGMVEIRMGAKMYRFYNARVNNTYALSLALHNNPNVIANDWAATSFDVSNIVNPKEFLTGQFYTIDYKGSADKDNQEAYKVGGRLAVRNVDGSDEHDYVTASGLYEKAPEAQWAVSAKYESDKIVGFTLTNRENPSVSVTITELRKDVGKSYYRVADVDNLLTNNYGIDKGDYITITPVAEHSQNDGYAVFDANDLRNKTWYLGQARQTADGDINVYWAENHDGSHQIGATVEEEKASKWNLSLVTKNTNVANKPYDTQIDSVLVVSTLQKWNAAKSRIDAVQDTLVILPYAFQNRSNAEFVKYNDGTNLNYYECRPYGLNEEKVFDKGTLNTAKDNFVSSDARFALKMKADGTYNYIVLAPRNGEKDDQNFYNLENGAVEAVTAANYALKKVFQENSTINGTWSQMGMYAKDANSLMFVTEVSAPEYRKLVSELGVDTVKIYRAENEAQVVYEKRDAKSVVEGRTLSFLNIDNDVQFGEINPALYVDTAYVNRGNNTRYQYLLGVNVTEHKGFYCPEHGFATERPCEHAEEVIYKTGRYLINMIDTANIMAADLKVSIHNNPYINETEEGLYCAKLSFVDAIHVLKEVSGKEGYADQLYVINNGDTTALDMSTPDFNVAKFAFKYVDSMNSDEFKIQTLWKDYDPEHYGTNAYKASSEEGYLRWVNGCVVVDNGYAKGDVFNMDENETRTPTANEEISAEGASVVVAGTNGAVVVKGAEGKNVIVSTILGKVVANEVVSSDNAQIATPAGIVVVSVDGESFKVVVK